jgi:hypothetical protein
VTTTDYFANPASPPITFDTPFPQTSAGTLPPANYQAPTRDFGVGYSQVRTLNLQYQLTENDMIELGYMGSFTLGQDRGVETNLAPPAAGPVQPRRRLPLYGSLRELRSGAKIFYNAASAKYVRRFSRGVTAQSSFTWSRAIDQSFGALAGPPNGGTEPQSYDNLSTRGLSASHRKFAWVTNAIWEMPWNPRGWAGVLLGGWQLSMISTLSSGGPFSVIVNGGAARINTGGAQRPFRIRDGNLPSGERTIQRWFETGAFVAPPLYTFGNAESLCVIMPGLVNFDFGLKKAFTIKEGMRIEYRAEFFNAFNHTNFGRPGVALGAPDFGVISTAGPARIVQMGLKLVF